MAALLSKTCGHCAEEFFRPKKSKATYCSQSCVAASRRHSYRLKYTNAQGYVFVRIFPEDPFYGMTYKNGYVKEHRLVMSRALGRPLTRDESVHHINGIRDDNRLENLELWVGAHCAGQRAEDAVAWAKEILERYEGLCLQETIH